jgi:hypothetical protein
MLEEIAYCPEILNGIVSTLLTHVRDALTTAILSDAKLLVGKNDAYQKIKAQEAQKAAENKNSSSD